MSRRQSSTAISIRHGGAGGVALDPNNPADDICPVCKTMRYLNRDMEFLINPECYHPMCSTCVNRIFNEGPNQCPYAGCNKTLRRRGFRAAYFGDLTIEREVDIRRRVAAVFNKAEDDFEDLNAYNEYLETVEDLTFALVNGKGSERAKAEEDLIAYEKAHKADIERNKRMGKESEERARKKMLAEQDAARQRRLQVMAEDAEERKEEARLKEEVLNVMAAAESGQAKQAINKIILKKRGQAKLADAMADLAPGAPSLSIRGLKEKKAPVEDNKPYDPFGGLDLTPTRYTLGDMGSYRNEWIDAARKKEDMRVGGYSAEEYISRAVYEAFAGLAVFVEEEQAINPVATTEAAIAAQVGTTSRKMDVDDVF